MSTIIEWNGRDIPHALFGVVPGAYLLVRTLTDAQKDAATLDFEELGVDPAYRDVPIAVLNAPGSFAGLDVEVLGDLETKATMIARERPGLWLRIPEMLRRLPADYALRGCATWRETAHHALMRVDPRHARTIRLRLGLDGPAEGQIGAARRLGVSAATVHAHEYRVARSWGHGWSHRVKAQLRAIVKHHRLRVSTLMKRDAFFAIDERDERALAVFIRLVDSSFELTQRHGAVYIARHA